MGAFLDKPKTEKHTGHGSGNGLRFGLSSMQGWRVEMEDAHTAVLGVPHGLDNWSFFAVYDGHAGSRVANYCSKHLLEHITSSEDFWGMEKPGTALEPTVEGVKSGIRTGFLKIDEYMRNFSDLRNGMDRSGSTAVAVLLSPEHLYFINCGDSRAVLYRNSQVCFSTQDHKPCNPREKERIQNAGGSVMIQRVNGSLAVSRALGDYDYKCVDGKGPTEQLVSPEPEVYEIPRCEEDEFVVLACDGIWDVMSNEELCEFVKSRLEIMDDLEKVCNSVVDTCLHKLAEPAFAGWFVELAEPAFAGWFVELAEPAFAGWFVELAEPAFAGWFVELAEPAFAGWFVELAEPAFAGWFVELAEPAFAGWFEELAGVLQQGFMLHILHTSLQCVIQ
ncbi:UNVERIFIED_CONTAM: hypothetical protein FKN15_033967 [Acipenser sinensis]